VRAAPVPAAPPNAPPPQLVSEATREWARVDKSSIAELETFIRRHGTSIEADYARARIEALKQEQAKRVAMLQEEEARKKAEAAAAEARARKGEEERKPVRSQGAFDGAWQIRRKGPGCAQGQDVRFLLLVTDRVVQGLSSGGQRIRGALSPSGEITFRHPTVDKDNKVDGRTAFYSGSLNGSTGSGTFSVPNTACRGTFTASHGS
jgi:hypothetical protein